MPDTVIDSTPLLPFDESVAIAAAHRARRARHVVRESSLAAFEAFKSKRRRIYESILKVLSRRGSMSARELFRLLKSTSKLPASSEIHTPRPRLTELSEIGALINPADPARRDEDGHAKPLLKRVGNDSPAMVWQITPKGRELLAHWQKDEVEK